MTNKYYKLLQKALRNTRPKASDPPSPEYRQWEMDCRALADVLAEESVMFEKQWFLANLEAKVTRK